MSQERINSKDLEGLLPAALQWAATQERRGLEVGARLICPEITLACRAGVLHPERVRFIYEATVPQPDTPELKAACENILRLNLDQMVGMTIGYAVFFRNDRRVDRGLVAHELRHVAQFEMHGGLEGFLAQYYGQLLKFGYDGAPFEQDARRFAGIICS